MTLINITLPDGTTKTTNVLPETTVKELLVAVGCAIEGITVFNVGDTPMIDLNRTMTYYNNWDVQRGYVSGLYVKYALTLGVGK